MFNHHRSSRDGSDGGGGGGGGGGGEFGRSRTGSPQQQRGQMISLSNSCLARSSIPIRLEQLPPPHSSHPSPRSFNHHHRSSSHPANLRDYRNVRSISPSHGRNMLAPPSRCLSVFGLNYDTTSRELKQIFSRYGEVESVNVINDRLTGASRGYAFVTFTELCYARRALDRLNGRIVHGRVIRVEYSLTARPHVPTPGLYLGTPSRELMNSRQHGGSALSSNFSYETDCRRRPDRYRSRGRSRSRSPYRPPRHRRSSSSSTDIHHRYKNRHINLH